jgi:hypothetical protein
MHALAHTLNDSPPGAAQGLRRRCPGRAQGVARACLGLAQGLPGAHPNLPRFAPLAAILAHHGRIASIIAAERPSMSIHDSHPPLVNGPNRNLPACPLGYLRTALPADIPKGCYVCHPSARCPTNVPINHNGCLCASVNGFEQRSASLGDRCVLWLSMIAHRASSDRYHTAQTAPLRWMTMSAIGKAALASQSLDPGRPSLLHRAQPRPFSAAAKPLET